MLFRQTSRCLEFSADLNCQPEIYLSGTLDQLAFASPSVKINDRERLDRSLSFAFSGNNAGIRINDINLVWDANNLQGRISSDLTDTKDLILNTSLIYNGTAVSLAGVFDNNGNPVAQRRIQP